MMIVGKSASIALLIVNPAGWQLVGRADEVALP